MTPAPLRNLWWHTSGGPVWHWRAWRQRAAWSPFMSSVADWLERWQPSRQTLVLIGPSAGWTLPGAFLQRFSTVIAVDPDPLARWLFSRRHRGLPHRWWPHDPLTNNGLTILRTAYPEAAFLFCNLAGQCLPEHQPSATTQIRHWREALQGIPWASYHDWISTERPPDRTDTRHYDAGTPLDTVVADFWQNGTLHLLDHLTGTLADAREFECALWPLRPGHWHLVQWVCTQG